MLWTLQKEQVNCVLRCFLIKFVFPVTVDNIVKGTFQRIYPPVGCQRIGCPTVLLTKDNTEAHYSTGD